MLEMLADVVIQYDGEGRILWCSQQLCVLMECEAEELIGKALPELGIDIPALSGQDHQSGRVEGVVHAAHGLRWFSWSEVCLHDDNGTTNHFAVAQDITASKTCEAALVQAKERAEQENLAKSRLLATVSHEIRTPMSGVIGMARLLSFTPLAPEQKTYIEAISTSAESLLTLVNELLDFSRIEVGGLVLEPQPVPIRELIEGVVELLAVRAFEKNLGIGSHISPEVPETFMVDPGRLRQILLNLVGNALKMTETGGVVVTACCPQRDQIVLTVEDTGPGMDKKTVARLFREFEQAEERRRHPDEGAGLGLAITRRLIVAMGGDVEVQTEPGRGASFIVRLPISGVEESVEKADVFSGLNVAILTPRRVEGRTLAMAVEARSGKAHILESEDIAFAAIREGEANFDVLVVDASLEAENEHMLSRLREKGLVATRILTLIAPTDRSRLTRLRAIGYDAFIARPPRGRTVVRLLSGDLPSSPMQPSMLKTRLRPHEADCRFKVLLAEDNRINALLTQKALHAAGCAVTIVATGAGAVDALTRSRSREYNLVIVDLTLPDLSGLTVIQRIRAHEDVSSLPPVPIIVLTADGQEKSRLSALKAGATAFMEKPPDPARLLSLLAKLSEN